MTFECWPCTCWSIPELSSLFYLSIHLAAHSSVLAWRIPGTVEPGGLPSMGLLRVGHDWSDSAAVILMAISHPLDYFSYNKSQNQVSWALPTLFFYKIVLAILDPLHFFINLELACQFLHKVYWGTPLVVQQLRLYTFNAGGMDMGSISGWELRICMLWGQKKKSLLRFCLV